MDKKWYILGTVIAFIVIIYFATSGKANNSDVLFPVTSFSHAHGLAVGSGDSNKLYIATHEGLYLLLNETNLYQIGESTDDYMGFSAHPTSEKVVFSSGHPVSGGNSGIQKSENGGVTWRKISNGVNGPVDFHAMAISVANSDMIYGWYQGQLQRSEDGGNNWKIVSNTDFVIVSLAPDPQVENRLFAASPQGLFVSDDKGVTWSAFDNFKNTFVSTVAINPQNSQQIFIFSEKLGGLAKSVDGGTTWNSISEPFEGATVLFIAFDKEQSTKLFALTHTNSLFKSNDYGETWKKIR